MFLKVLIAFILGIAFGGFFPEYTGFCEIISTIFIRSIKLVIVPIIFFSLIAGMCSHADDKSRVSKLFAKAIIYFEIMSILAILITFGFMLLFKPGQGVDTHAFPDADISRFVAKAQGATFKDFLYGIFPDNFFDTLTSDHLLAVIFLALISSIAILRMPQHKPVIRFVEHMNQFFFQIINLVISFSPIATFAAISYSVGHAGIDSLSNLAGLVLVVILSMVFFCLFISFVAVLFFGIPVMKLLVYIKQELLIALATSSSESVFPQLLDKLQKFGYPKKSVSFVLPLGYSFNLDGTAIYVTAGTLFIQQAYQVPFATSDYLMLFFIMIFTSKGAAGVTGAGFITLAATLASIPGNPLPVAGLTILLGIDRFMSDARTICNIVGNVVGTAVISTSERK